MTIDCTDMNESARVLLFGESFRFIDIKCYEVKDGVIYTTIIHKGNELVLVGDPEAELNKLLHG